jgi:hypothetical protein
MPDKETANAPSNAMMQTTGAHSFMHCQRLKNHRTVIKVISVLSQKL